MHDVGEHCVKAHVAEHTPEAQNGAVAPQTVPQAPQFVALLDTSTHDPEQTVGRTPLVQELPVAPLVPVAPPV